MRYLLPTALVVALMSGSVETLAQSAPVGLFYALGQTSTSCGEFVNAAEYNNRARLPADPPATFSDPVTAGLMSWVEGFLSGINLTWVRPIDWQVKVSRPKPATDGSRTTVGATHLTTCWTRPWPCASP